MTDHLDVRIFATLRLASGKSQLRFPRTTADATVRDVLRWLDEQLSMNAWEQLVDDRGTIRPGTMLLVDGKNVHHLQGLDTPISGERLDVFPPSGGG